MANNGQTDTAVLVAMLSERAAVNVRLALAADACASGRVRVPRRRQIQPR